MSGLKLHSANAKHLLVAIVLLGIGLRLFYLCSQRPVWADEAALLVNIVHKGYLALLGPLDAGTADGSPMHLLSPNEKVGGYPANQICPLLFRWMLRLIYDSFGLSVAAFRSCSAIFACLALTIHGAWTWRRLTPAVALISTGLLAFSGLGIRYSTEIKPYSADLLIASLAFGYIAWRPRFADVPLREVVLLCLAGALAVWISFPSVIVLFALGATYGAEALSERNGKAALRLALIPAAWILSFGIHYYFIARSAGTDPKLLQMHRDIGWVGPGIPRSLRDLRWYVDAFTESLPSLVEIPAAWCGLAFLISIGGVFGLWRQRPPLALMMMLTVTGTICAAAIGKYAIAPRLLLFITPAVAVLAASGVVAFADLFPRAKYCVAAVAATIWCLNVGNILGTWRDLKASRNASASHDFNAAFTALRAAPASSAVYVDPDSGPAFQIAAIQSHDAPHRIYCSGKEIHWSAPESLHSHILELVEACKGDTVDLLINDGRASACHIALIQTLLAEHGHCENLGTHGGIVILRYDARASSL